MLVTTWLMSLVMVLCWHKNILLAIGFIFFFSFNETLYFSAALIKFLEGAWVPIIVSFIFMIVMYIWHYGTIKKYEFGVQNMVSIDWLLSLGPTLGIVRVRGIGFMHTELVLGIPVIFSHFVTNLHAFHQVYVPSKLMAEEKAFQFAKDNGIDLVSVIPPTGRMILAHLCDEPKGLKTGICMSMLFLPLAIANALTARLMDGVPLFDEFYVLIMYCVFTVGLYLHFATSVIHEITGALGICCFSILDWWPCGNESDYLIIFWGRSGRLCGAGTLVFQP